MGDGAGAASVGMHLLSPLSVNKGFYRNAVLMSGTDLSPRYFLNPFWQPRRYAFQLAELVGCPSDDTYLMMACMKNNKTVSWSDILEAQEKIKPIDGALGVVWAPTQDGGYRGVEPFLPESPMDLRRQGKYAEVPMMIGLNAQDGAKIANASVNGLEGGMFPPTFEKFVLELMESWKVIDVYRARSFEAVEFQYTYWPDPGNQTARGQEFINMITDLVYGAGMNDLVRQHSESGKEPVWMYVFDYKSWSDWLPYWMGVSHSALLPHVMGFPFLNESILNETELVPRQWYDYEDRNMSDWMMYMWSNFAIYGEPTPNITRNITWDPYNYYNLSYLHIDFHTHNWYRYRQAFYGFWSDYFPSIARKDYLFPTPTPTPAGFEYVISTGAMSTLMIVLLCAVVLISYLLWRQSRWEEDQAAVDTGMPLNFFEGRSMGGSQSMDYTDTYPSKSYKSSASQEKMSFDDSFSTDRTASRRPYNYPQQHSVV